MTGRHTLRRRPAHQRAARARRLQRARRWWPPGAAVSRTTRHAYDGQPIRDGQHGRRCPSAHCEWCSKGRARRQKPQPEEDQ